METHTIHCQCSSDEHHLVYRFDPDERTIYTSVYLHQYRGFWKRVWVAVKYVFGYQSKYGAWDCVDMGPEQVKQLHALTVHALKDQAAAAE